MLRLLLHSPLAALDRLHLVEPGAAPHPHLVVHQPGLLDHHVCVWRVPLYEDRAENDTSQYGQQDGLVNVVILYNLLWPNIVMRRPSCSK